MTRTDIALGIESALSHLGGPTTSPSTTSRRGPHIGMPSILPRALAVLDATLAWHARARQRRELRQLDDRLLRDIGVTPTEAEDEWRKPFWRP